MISLENRLVYVVFIVLFYYKYHNKLTIHIFIIKIRFYYQTIRKI